jgi:FG-GAP repeat protein
VAIAGPTAIVGAYCHHTQTGATYAFTRSGTAWSRHAELTAADGATSGFFGDSAAISGSAAVVGTYLRRRSAPRRPMTAHAGAGSDVR